VAPPGSPSADPGVIEAKNGLKRKLRVGTAPDNRGVGRTDLCEASSTDPTFALRDTAEAPHIMVARPGPAVAISLTLR